jgi:N-methylhydantoinase A
MNSLRYRIGVDIGGTFTDVVLLANDGSIVTKKVSSTTDDYGRAILAGIRELLEELKLAPAAVDEIVHGTTIATNAILEGKGAETALITTKGFRDVLELQRIRIPELYNLFYEKPTPLVPRHLRLEVDERIGPRGEIWRPLDMESVSAAIATLQETPVEAVAICLLHSYANPEHERVVTEAVRSALSDPYITCSIDILPEIREYERTSTTVINSYVGPVAKRYLESLVKQLREFGLEAPLLIMQSNGGVMTADSAIQRPAYFVESGPAAGVKASGVLARSVDYPNLITLDMGGTTAKASVIEEGEVTLTSEYEVGAGINVSSMLVKGGGHALRLPVIDVAEIGAGGGSVCWVDEGGRLHVGPRSAGATPGPVCYDAGGTEPTVTDANVALAYINPEYLAGGEVTLDADKAVSALEEKIARPLGLSLLEAAHGIHTLASANMVRAVKAVSTYRGRDPRDFTLLAFGGSGPVHAAEMARILEMKRIIIPPAAGLFSAVGLLFSNIEHQIVRTYLRPADERSTAQLNAAFADLEQEALSVLDQQGYEAARLEVSRYADMRYADQGYELTIPVPAGPFDSNRLVKLVEAFNLEHLKTYGHQAENEAVDIVNLRATARVVPDGTHDYRRLTTAAFERTSGSLQPSTREAFFGFHDGLVETPVVARSELTEKRTGPLIVEEYDATCVVPPDCTASLDDWGNILMEMHYS